MKSNKVLFGIYFWLVSLTWGALMTVPGLIVTGILALCGCKVHKNGVSYIVEVGGNWGGLELGAVALCGNYSETNPYWFEHTRRHEFGHALQNLAFGPLQPFIVGIPSVIRYWYHRLSKRSFPDDWYDSIWFEGTATKYGTKMINYLEDTEF